MVKHIVEGGVPTVKLSCVGFRKWSKLKREWELTINREMGESCDTYSFRHCPFSLELSAVKSTKEAWHRGNMHLKRRLF